MFLNSLRHFQRTWGDKGNVKWLVDRFHYFGHARVSEDCRHSSNPMDYKNRGLVRVLSCQNVGNEYQNEREKGLFGVKDFIDDPDHVGEGAPKTVEVRRVIRNIHNGTTCRMALMDDSNMSIAESTFSNLQAYGPLLKKMSASRSRYYIREVVVSKNNMATKKLDSQGMHPFPVLEKMVGAKSPQNISVWVLRGYK